jgi:hypothetical protein
MASPRLQCGKGLPVWHGWKNIGGSQKGICLRNVETGVQSKRLVYLFNCSRIACIWNRFPRPGGHQRNGWPVGRFAASLNNAGGQNGRTT